MKRETYFKQITHRRINGNHVRIRMEVENKEIAKKMIPEIKKAIRRWKSLLGKELSFKIIITENED